MAGLIGAWQVAEGGFEGVQLGAGGEFDAGHQILDADGIRAWRAKDHAARHSGQGVQDLLDYHR